MCLHPILVRVDYAQSPSTLPHMFPAPPGSRESQRAPPAVSWADTISINDDDSIKTVLTAQMGKRVSIKTKSGQELSGTVTTVTDKLTHIAKLTGKEFYDAIVVNSNIEAVIIRTK